MSDVSNMTDTDLAKAVAYEVLEWQTPPEYSVTRWVAKGVVQYTPRIDWSLAVAVLDECRRRERYYNIEHRQNLAGEWHVEVFVATWDEWLCSSTHGNPPRAICEAALAAVRAQRDERQV